jgi:cyanophycin synthetase
VASGGHTRGVTVEFHPDNARLCEQVAKLLRLDIVGIDLLIPDHLRSWCEGGAAICEVNAQPQMGLTYPEIYENLFNAFLDGQGRIPVGLVLTDNPGSAGAIREGLLTLSATPALRVVVEGTLMPKQDAYGDSPTLSAALINPDTRSLVVVSNGESFGQKGLSLDRFDVLWIADWRGTQAQLQQRLSLIFPHLASGQILIDEKLSALLDGQRHPSSDKFRFGDLNAIALAVGQRLAGLSGGPAAC